MTKPGRESKTAALWKTIECGKTAPDIDALVDRHHAECKPPPSNILEIKAGVSSGALRHIPLGLLSSSFVGDDVVPFAPMAVSRLTVQYVQSLLSEDTNS